MNGQVCGHNGTIIIYGAGRNGRRFYDFLKQQNLSDIVAFFCDQNESIKSIEDKKVLPYHMLRDSGVAFVISIEESKDVEKMLYTDGHQYYKSVKEWLESRTSTETELLGLLKKYFLGQRDIVKEVHGRCPCCNKKTLFLSTDYWLRDNYKCVYCESIPRQRALMKVLNDEFPNWKNMKVHESSPSGATLKVFEKLCAGYSYSFWCEREQNGASLGDNATNQNLENLSFEDSSFDIFITQDVFEHINNPLAALNEIARTLKIGGKHIFTVPIYAFQKSRPRIKIENGKIVNILPPTYHENPISKEGSLVTYDWGMDIAEIIDEITGMETKVVSFPNSKENFECGLEADFLYVVVSEKVK